jgi:hypothetical protein
MLTLRRQAHKRQQRRRGNNADWYRLLDLCGLTNTLIGDADGLSPQAMFNDRLLLRLKGNHERS